VAHQPIAPYRRERRGRLSGKEIAPGVRVAKSDMLRSALGLAFCAGISLAGVAAQAGGTLVVGMTAGDLPITTGNPDQGFEGYRFVGYNLYDSLILWDLSKNAAGKARRCLARRAH